MPLMHIRPMTILAGLLALAGCAEGVGPTTIRYQPVEIGTEVARLQSLGFRRTASTDSGTQVLSYAGPVTRAVQCREGSGAYQTISPRRSTATGQRADITLDAYLQLTPGDDGILNSGERSGVYAVSIVYRSPDGRQTVGVDRIVFPPTGTARTKSGLTCRAS